MKFKFKLTNLQLFADELSAEQIKALQDDNKKLKEENQNLATKNKALEDENNDLKSKSQEQSSSVKELKDDIAKLKEEVKEGFANNHKGQEDSQDSKPKTLLEELRDITDK